MNVEKYKICRIGIEIEKYSEEDHISQIFVYKKAHFKKVFDFDFETLLYDVSFNRDLNLEVIEEAACNVLCLVVSLLNNTTVGAKRNNECRLRLLKICSITDLSFLPKASSENENDFNKDSLSNYVFELLKKSHEYNNFADFDEVKLAGLLRPILRPYQVKAVKWMISLETSKQKIMDYNPIKFKDCPNKVFYINKYNLDITCLVPNIFLPNGGILADEMGLGKTIEMLSLILLRKESQIQFEYDSFSNELNNGPSLPKIMKKQREILCVCSNTSNRKKSLIKCVECHVMQHIKCVRRYSKPSDPHICPSCWSNKTQLIPSSATVIVTPATIKRQWYLEIMKHVKSNLNILMYSGVKDHWISPNEVASYDIILTDYNILKGEIYFSADNKSHCIFRKSKKYMRTESPLLKVLWYRVCLDEAQMVESSNAKASQMVKLLPAKHRWAVTGTPIQKSIDDIRGLLEFLDAYPFYEKSYWRVLVDKFFENDVEPLFNLLGKLMWRTCKRLVIRELNIPDQLEEIHYINLDDAEQLFYSNERQICAESFNSKVSKIIEESALSVVISKFDTNTLKKILEPLKKLRQDCTVPMLLKLHNNQNQIKKLLQPQELLEHLKTSNEVECKNQIRHMASNYNGLAAIHMIKEEYDMAVKMYKSVMGLAKEFSDSLSVDTLLQIHALHNMQAAYELLKKTTDEVFKVSLEKSDLEWRYINTYYKKYLETLDSWSKTAQILNQKFKTSAVADINKLFFDIFEEINQKNMSDEFISKIKEDSIMMKSGLNDSLFNEYFISIKTIEIYIYNWFNSIFSDRENLLVKFKCYAELIDTIKPRENLNSEVSSFFKNVYECHLQDIRSQDNRTKKEINQLKGECDLCKSKISLGKYECLIFDKHMDERTHLTDGTWNPCVQENILKLALSFSKNKNIYNKLEDVESSLEVIDILKKEYKELSKLWIEIEYIAKAFDELDMCKMRLTAIEEEIASETKISKNAIYQIPIFQIEETFHDLNAQLSENKIEFNRKLGRLKYIRHLAKNTEPDNCPICKTRPKTKYCVLDCGHIMCVLCLNELGRYRQNHMINCAICRAKINNIYYVTGKKSENENFVKGEYSTKINKIVSVILKLKLQDAKVKILIFSHWESILKIISTALSENCVEHRLMWSAKSIEEFKDANFNVTCMLMLLAHGSKGLNLIESSHVFLVEPILNIADELQAINRVHRIGQTKVTTVHRFIVKNTIEENIFNTMSKLKSLEYNNLTIETISKFFYTDSDSKNFSN